MDKHKLTYNKVYSNLILFSNFGQFIREGNKSFIFISNLINSIIWILFSIICGNILLDLKLNLLTWIGMIICFRCFIASLERYSDNGIDYTLSDDFPISNIKIFSLRLLAKLLQPSELFFIVSCVLICLFNGFNLFYSIAFGLLLVLIIYTIEETVSFLTYKVSNLKVFYIIFAVVEIGIVAITFFFKEQFNKIVNPEIIILISLVIILIVLGVLFFVFLNSFKKMRRKVKHNKSAIQKVKKQNKISYFGVLLKKELSYFLKYNLGLTLKILISALFFMFISGYDKSTNIVFSTIFCFELAYTYGFNYFGVEESSYQLIILSPVDRNLIIKAKSITFLIMGYIGSFLIIIISLLMKRIDFSMEIIKSIAFCTLVTATFLFINPLMSIKFFKINGQKNNYGIKCLLLIFGITILMYLLIFVFYFLIKSTIFIALLSSFVMFIAIFATVLLPTYYSSKLIEEEKRMLKIINRC